MKRFIMEFQLPNENLESAQEMGFYLTQLSNEFIGQLEQMDTEMFRKWSEGNFGMSRGNPITGDTVFVARIKDGPIDQRDEVVMRKEISHEQ